ncbi:MAG: hypothetical protein CUN51_00905 [Candidatus Thermofonsia Clade 1 bacterium]|uniref:Uncharacterized protein n=1 Tax=Candidatus Thermofonsia Clade 1 bacterium TaxID=2364210 RepID=A0A2M8P3U5_9CHLR|nr:MAG: hypothetical protein CUN51_00905 [Candidatus Thermofonsia Clade 1 bacterium]
MKGKARDVRVGSGVSVMLAKGAVSRVGIGSVAKSVSVGLGDSVGVALGSGVSVAVGKSAAGVGTPLGNAIHVASAVVVQSMAPATLIMSAQTKKRKPACPAARRCRQ